MELQSELDRLMDPKWEPFSGCRAETTKHDAAAAHALVRELNALLKESRRRRSHEGELAVNLLEIVFEQASRQMAIWGFTKQAGVSDGADD